MMKQPDRPEMKDLVLSWEGSEVTLRAASRGLPHVAPRGAHQWGRARVARSGGGVPSALRAPRWPSGCPSPRSCPVGTRWPWGAALGPSKQSPGLLGADLGLLIPRLPFGAR